MHVKVSSAKMAAILSRPKMAAILSRPQLVKGRGPVSDIGYITVHGHNGGHIAPTGQMESIGILYPQLRRLNKTLTTKKTSTLRIIAPLLGKTTGFQVMTSSLKQMSKRTALVVDCGS